MRVRGFLLAAVPVRNLVPAWSLKTQQRETSRPLSGVSPWVENEPVFFFLWKTTSSALRTAQELEWIRPAGLVPANDLFTESLILAQDERWRRA